MRVLLMTGVAVAALLGATAAQAASVEIKDAAARVVVIPENRTDVKVEFLTTNPGLPLTLRTEGDKTVVDGDLGRGAIRSCHTSNGEASVSVRGKSFGWDALPQVVVRVPMDAEVAAAGAVFGSVGRSNSLELSNAGCGDWTVGNVAGELKINLAGSGDTTVGTAGATSINIAGSGDVDTAAISGALAVNIAGSGDVEAAAVTGPVNANIMGSGDVAIIAPAESVSARIAGSGDVRVVSVSGPVSKKVAGSGSVVVGPIDAAD